MSNIEIERDIDLSKLLKEGDPNSPIRAHVELWEKIADKKPISDDIINAITNSSTNNRWIHPLCGPLTENVVNWNNILVDENKTDELIDSIGRTVVHLMVMTFGPRTEEDYTNRRINIILGSGMKRLKLLK